MKKIGSDLPILADLCRADLLLCCREREDRIVIVAQARPHSSSPLYEEDECLNTRVKRSEQEEIFHVFEGKGKPHQVHTVFIRGATVARQLFPVYNERGQVIAVLVKDAYWLAHERHRRRSRVFQEALLDFIAMVLRGELKGAEELSPFGEHDGIMYVGPDRRIQYMSGIASELFRHLGYRDTLVGRRINDIETVDAQLVARAIAERRCLESQSEQDGFTWTRKALPVTIRDRSLWQFLQPWKKHREARKYGAFVLIHDATEALRTQRELESKMAMLREVHHRVKNNLQVIASIMRMQARRTSSEEARAVLEESVQRVLSVAVVHEFLSQNARGMINLRDVANRILAQIKQGLVDPLKKIELEVEGPDIWLPAERATQCSLVMNELVQNAIEHGLAQQERGAIHVQLVDQGEEITILVEDNGQGLPEGFNLDTDANLGLRIVKSMVERDLRGKFTLRGSPYGTQAIVRFAKLS
ncbi:MAG: histidine kinase N-terminal domain-containing protein [Anaerolineae bacterium]|nr:histidine kinase N-terminal domain-containing protein [Anaerolineae bacterium]